MAASLLDEWCEPLPPEKRDALLDQAATLVVRRGMEAPAVWALEMHKPLAFLGSQALLVGAPFFGPLLGPERLQTLSRLLAEPGIIEALIRRIEELSASPTSATTTKS